jgi:hypothetical protein
MHNSSAAGQADILQCWLLQFRAATSAAAAAAAAAGIMKKAASPATADEVAV